MCESSEPAQVAAPPPIKRLQRGDQAVLAQLLSLEKRSFKKTDNWGDLLIKETQRRNTFLLYAEAPPGSAASPPAQQQQQQQLQQPRAPPKGSKPAQKQRGPAPSPPQQQQQQPQVVAYLVYTTTGLNAHISKLAVAPEWRRRGLARALVREAVRAARTERRAASVSLHVADDNPPALALYRGEGFESEALLEDYYCRGRHAHKMRLELDSGL